MHNASNDRVAPATPPSSHPGGEKLKAQSTVTLTSRTHTVTHMLLPVSLSGLVTLLECRDVVA